MPPIHLAIVTNCPAPYRVPVYNRLAHTDGIVFHAFYCVEREPDRLWDLPPYDHPHTFFNGHMYVRGGKFIHNNPEVWRRLRDFSPDVIITTGYNPTHLYAIAFALLHGIEHVPMTDGTDLSESNLTLVHRRIRSFVLRRSRAFIAASSGGRRLFHQYGVNDKRIHLSPLCANTTADWTPNINGKSVDLLFSGRLVQAKNPDFFLEVAVRLAALMGRKIVVALLGVGPKEGQLRERANGISNSVDVIFAGHITQMEIPTWFTRSQLFLFPTDWDVWGVVVNEACMAGLPVITSPNAGVVNELVIDKANGYVLELDVNLWATAAARILQDEELYAEMSSMSIQLVGPYNFDSAAEGIAAAARMSLDHSGPRSDA